MKSTLAILFSISTLALSACDQGPPTADQVMQQKQAQLAAEGNSQVGMPAITNFARKRELKMIQELADKEQPTFAYTQDMNGHYHKICDSLGYGIPAATQYTNPQYIAYTGGNGSVATLPQADPDGLFSPASSDATWIMCLDPQTKKMAPVYVEPRVTVSPFPLQ